jgi:hypothetical protein
MAQEFFVMPNLKEKDDIVEQSDHKLEMKMSKFWKCSPNCSQIGKKLKLKVKNGCIKTAF